MEETQSQELELGLGRRSPSPPPPPPQSPEEALARSEGAEDQESAAAPAAVLPLVDDHGDVDEGVDEEEGTAAEESVEVPAVLTDDLRDKIVRQVIYLFLILIC